MYATRERRSLMATGITVTLMLIKISDDFKTVIVMMMMMMMMRRRRRRRTTTMMMTPRC